MTDRARRSTETGTGVAPGAPGRVDSFETDVTDVTSRPRLPAVEVPTPTYVEPPGQATPTEVTARAERSEPIRVISMKDATEPRRERSDERRAVQVQLRSIAEVRRRQDTPVDLGHLAPPRDPRQARNRRLVDNVIWGCVAIVLACGIMLAIWLVAGR